MYKVKKNRKIIKEDKTLTRKQFKRILLNFVEKKEVLFALIIIIFLVIISIFAPLLSSYDPIKQDLKNAMLKMFSGNHLLGTDELGRDLFSRILYGGRITIGLSILTIFFAMCIGTFLGVVAGYFGGIFDTIIMRLIDIVLAFPCLILGIIVVSVFGPGLRNAAFAVAIYNIPIFARVARIETLNIKTNEFIEASVSFGISDFKIILTHILPNIISCLVILSTLNIGNAVIIISSLGFIGMGAQPPIPEWGAILSSGRKFILIAPHIIFVPGFFLFLLVLSLNLLGDGLRDSLDPTLQH